MLILGESDLILKHIEVKKQELRQTSKLRGSQFRRKVFNLDLNWEKCQHSEFQYWKN